MTSFLGRLCQDANVGSWIEMSASARAPVLHFFVARGDAEGFHLHESQATRSVMQEILQPGLAMTRSLTYAKHQ